MNSDSLRTFITLAELESYTKTAQKMLVVQSTVTKRIKELETEIGQQLVIRDKKSLRLTAAGRIFFKYAEEIIEMEDTCRRKLLEAEQKRSSICIGSVQSLFEGCISGYLAKFCKAHKEIYVNVKTESSQFLLNHLYDDTIDMCFSYRKFAAKNYICEPFVKDEMILVTGKGKYAYQDGITDKQLKKLPLIHEGLSCVSDAQWLQHIYEENEMPIMRVGTGNFIIPLLRKGLGYGFVVRSYVQEYLENEELQEIFLVDHPNPVLQSYMVYKATDGFIKKSFVQYIKNIRDKKLTV